MGDTLTPKTNLEVILFELNYFLILFLLEMNCFYQIQVLLLDYTFNEFEINQFFLN